jgi:hypothetical protein
VSTSRGADGGILSNWPFSEFLRNWDYRPRTSWFQHFITINNNAGDVGVEQTVLEEVGSYGYQLSRILDALNAVVDQLEKTHTLGADQQQAVANLRQLTSSVDSSVKSYWARQPR